MLKLRCWIYGEEPSDTLCVNMPKVSTIEDLKEAIKAQESKFYNVAAHQLTLYSIPLSHRSVLTTWRPIDPPLDPATKLTTLSNQLIIIYSFPLDLTLTYWVKGDRLDDYSFIKVSSRDTFAEVIKAMQTMNARFRDIDFTLYRAPFSCTDEASLEEALSSCTFSELGRPARDSRKLSEDFAMLATDQLLHLIVIPDVSWFLQGWIRGARIDSSFKINISMRCTVWDLKVTIKAACSTLNHLSPDLLGVYKVTTHDDDMLREVLESLGTGQLLQGHHILRDVFHDVPFSHVPRIVVEVVNKGCGDPITTACGESLQSTKTNKITCDKMPFSNGNPCMFQEQQLESSIRIPCGRPRKHEGPIPIDLLHPVFHEFLDDRDNIEETARDHQLVDHLRIVMSDFYADDLERVRAVVDAFACHEIPLAVTETETKRCFPDVGMTNNGHHYVIVKFEDETGSTSAEPYLQAMSHYVDATSATALKHVRSPLPCFLLTIFGSSILFAGATWNLFPVAQILSPIVLNFYSTDIVNRCHAARHMAAFRKATEQLKQYYEYLQPPPTLTQLPQLFPYPTSYTSLADEAEMEFCYKKVLHDDALTFSGVEGNADRICIKFVQTYSPDAHQFLAELKRAPALRGYKSISTRWIMVVMDLLPDDFVRLNAHKTLPDSLFDEISTTLKSFHASNFVHGDICDINIMVSKTHKEQFMIVNFDLAGRRGEARYPFLSVNYIDIKRPKGARDGEMILAEHDLEMLGYIRAEFSSRS